MGDVPEDFHAVVAEALEELWAEERAAETQAQADEAAAAEETAAVEAPQDRCSVARCCERRLALLICSLCASCDVVGADSLLVCARSLHRYPRRSRRPSSRRLRCFGGQRNCSGCGQAIPSQHRRYEKRKRKCAIINRVHHSAGEARSGAGSASRSSARSAWTGCQARHMRKRAWETRHMTRFTCACVYIHARSR